MEFLSDFAWIFHEISKYFEPQGSIRRWIMLGTIILGVSSGVIGTFALLRKESLLSDAMAHAALPGICIVYMITQIKDPILFLIGASTSGLLGAATVTFITRNSRIKNDTAIGLVLSVFFAMGIVLLTIIQKKYASEQAGLDSFLFGKAALLVHYDIYVMASMCLLLVLLTCLFYKEFKLLTFDPEFAMSIGFPIRSLEMFITTLIVIAVMVGLQTVGVVLMVAMLIFPAAAARQWTNQLATMIIISAIIGAISGATGTFVSAAISRVPTGPVMVVVCSFILLVSMFFAPNRGLVPKWFRIRKNQNRVQRENILKHFYNICEDNQNWEYVKTETLLKHGKLERKSALKHLKELVKRNFIVPVPKGWELTPLGKNEAQQITRKYRLWKVYLKEQMDIAKDHLQRDAENIEHVIDANVVKQLEKELKEPSCDPHGKPIPRNFQGSK